MPRLVRLYIVNVAIGFLIALAFVAGLVVFDVAGLRGLSATADGPLALVLLWFFNGIVFAGVQFAVAIMMMAEDTGPRGGRRRPLRLFRAPFAPQPARIRAEAHTAQDVPFRPRPTGRR